MKKKGVMFLLLGTFLVSLSGCGAEMLLPSVLTAGSAALTVADVKESMKNVDYIGTIKTEFDQVWKAALATIKEMGIEVTKKALNEKGNGGIITGKTETHQKIQIIVSATTPAVTSIGIKARKREIFNMPITAADVDTPFASMILNTIIKECQKGTT